MGTSSDRYNSLKKNNQLSSQQVDNPLGGTDSMLNDPLALESQVESKLARIIGKQMGPTKKNTSRQSTLPKLQFSDERNT